jgi:hypothetical protein
MTHLSDREFVDVLDGEVAADAASHIRDCPTCRERLADLAATLAHARRADVPEPSPLFWDHLSERIRADIASTAAPVRARWLAWPMWLPTGGLALIVALALTGPVRHASPVPARPLAQDVPLHDDDRALEAAIALTADFFASGDATALESDTLVRPGSAELAAADLTRDEQLELLRLLQLELKAGG